MEIGGHALLDSKPALETAGKTLAVVLAPAILVVIVAEAGGGEVQFGSQELPDGGFKLLAGEEAVVDVKEEDGWPPKGGWGHPAGGLEGDAGGLEARFLGRPAAKFVAAGQGAVAVDNPKAGDFWIGVLVEEAAHQARRETEELAKLGIGSHLMRGNLPQEPKQLLALGHRCILARLLLTLSPEA